MQRPQPSVLGHPHVRGAFPAWSLLPGSCGSLHGPGLELEGQEDASGDQRGAHIWTKMPAQEEVALGLECNMQVLVAAPWHQVGPGIAAETFPVPSPSLCPIYSLLQPVLSQGAAQSSAGQDLTLSISSCRTGKENVKPSGSFLCFI